MHRLLTSDVVVPISAYGTLGVAKLADAAGGATFESAAVILASGAVISVMFYGVFRIIREVRGSAGNVKDAVHVEADAIQKHTEGQVIKANGVTVAFLENLRIPAWYKDSMGVMRYINPAYAVTFGVMVHEYVGRRDDDVWPIEIARAFQKHDAEVMLRRAEVQFTERVPERAKDLNSPVHDWFVVKFPVLDPVSQQCKGVAGYCLPIEMAQRAAEGKGSLWVLARDTAVATAPNPLSEPVQESAD